MWNRIKSAWLVLRGKAYAIPYATHYEAMLWEATGAKQIKMSQMQNPHSWNPTRQKDGAARNTTNKSDVAE